MYELIRNSLSLQYGFTFSLLIKDVYSSIDIIKKKYENCGKILNFMYIHRPFEDKNCAVICSEKETQMLDCCMNSLFSNSKSCRRILYRDCQKIGELFHLSATELEYYYFVACVCYVLESQYTNKITVTDDLTNEQINEVNKVVNEFKNMISSLINIEEEN